MFYALSDSFTGDLPAEFTDGFSNTKEVIAFSSRAARSEWLSATRLLTARPLTRAQALRRADRAEEVALPGENGCESGDLVARVAYSGYGEEVGVVWHVVRKARRAY